MTLRISAARDEKGVALPLALLGLMMLSGLLVAFLGMGANEPLIAQNLGSSSRAFHIADAGIEHAWAFLSTAALPLANGNLFADQPFGAVGPAVGTYSVTVSNQDPPGTPLPAGTYLLTSTGKYKRCPTCEEGSRTITARVSVTPAGGGGPGLPTIPAAVTSVSNGSDETDYESTSFVTGNEESGAACTSNKAGWLHRSATAGTGPASSYQFDYQGGTLEGVGGAGALAHRAFNAATDDPMFNNPATLRAWVNNLGSQPGVVNVNGVTGHPTTMGTAADPKITVWNLDDTGQHSTNAAITGYGILILKGPSVGNGQYHWFNVEKGFKFNGLIIIDSPGEVSFTHYKSPPDVVLHGAIIAVSEKTGAEATKVDFEKNTQLYYNCDSIAKYAVPLAGSGCGGGGSNTVAMLGWKQQ